MGGDETDLATNSIEPRHLLLEGLGDESLEI